jgi:hypothetical protein
VRAADRDRDLNSWSSAPAIAAADPMRALQKSAK